MSPLYKPNSQSVCHRQNADKRAVCKTYQEQKLPLPLKNTYLYMSNISTEYFAFFKELTQNNNREWFHANKPRFETHAREPFYGLVEAIAAHLVSDEPYLTALTGKEATFRINRDIRFGADKSPYKLYLSACINAGGTKNKDVPGHYLELGYGELVVGGGAYFVEKEWLLRIRRAIAADPQHFAALTNAPEFVQYFGEIKGARNKRLAPEFAAVQGITPYIANTQFYWMTSLPPTQAATADAADVIATYYRATLPLVAFFKQALG